MKCRTINETKAAMLEYGEHWRIPFMEFVDDFRRLKDLRLIEKPFALGDERFDSLLASAIEHLCAELDLETPSWSWGVPACKSPWFVSDVENLKAIAIAESPAHFRRRKIFVLGNFLARA
jgi:hypothetical protein